MLKLRKGENASAVMPLTLSDLCAEWRGLLSSWRTICRSSITIMAEAHGMSEIENKVTWPNRGQLLLWQLVVLIYFLRLASNYNATLIYHVILLIFHKLLYASARGWFVDAPFWSLLVLRNPFSPSTIGIQSKSISTRQVCCRMELLVWDKSSTGVLFGVNWRSSLPHILIFKKYFLVKQTGACGLYPLSLDW